MKIVLTGGHITPLIATIEALQKDATNTCVVISRKHSAEGVFAQSQESQILEQKGIATYFLTTGRLQRSLTRHTIPSLLKIPWGIIGAYNLLRLIKPDVVVSFGGYLSVPVIIAAWTLRISTVTHEQSVKAGLANRINSKFVKKVALAWESSLPFFPKAKSVVVGNPLRQAIFANEEKQTAIGQFLKTENTVPLLYVTGGNQGSHAINTTIFSLVSKLSEQYKILHQTGNLVSQDVEYSQQLSWKNNRYMAVPFVTDDDIGPVLHKASLVISRAGANTVTELAALGKVAIFIPLPFAQQQEQLANAQLLEKAGSSVIIDQANLTPDLIAQKLQEIQKNSQLFAQHAEAAKLLVKPEAAVQLAQLITSLGN